MHKNTPTLFDSPASGPHHHNKQPRSTDEPPTVPGARWIPLTRGLFALIDEADFDSVAARNWSARPARRTVYAASTTGSRGRHIYLHRFLMNAPDGMQVDHKDGNGLNCRRDNLRVCTVQQNRCNTGKTASKCTSQYMGVCWDPTRSKWRATIKFNKKYVHQGRHSSEVDAARAYDRAARELFGEFARLNFPDETEPACA